MKSKYVGTFKPYIAPYNNSVVPLTHEAWTLLGSQKSVPEFNWSEKLKGVTILESGNEPIKFLHDINETKLKLELSDFTIAKLDEWVTGIKNFEGITVENDETGIGDISTARNVVGNILNEFILRLHPSELPANNTSYDIVILRCCIDKKFEKKGTNGENASVILEINAEYDNNGDKIKFGLFGDEMITNLVDRNLSGTPNWSISGFTLVSEKISQVDPIGEGLGSQIYLSPTYLETITTGEVYALYFETNTTATMGSGVPEWLSIYANTATSYKLNLNKLGLASHLIYFTADEFADGITMILSSTTWTGTIDNISLRKKY